MAVEAATYISQLDPALPTGGGSVKEGDNIFQLLKSVLQNTFPNATGAITPTPGEFNTLAGAASTGATTLRVVTKAASDSSTFAASTAFVAGAVASASVSNSGPLVMLALMEQGIA